MPSKYFSNSLVTCDLSLVSVKVVSSAQMFPGKRMTSSELNWVSRFQRMTSLRSLSVIPLSYSGPQTSDDITYHIETICCIFLSDYIISQKM